VKTGDRAPALLGTRIDKERNQRAVDPTVIAQYPGAFQQTHPRRAALRPADRQQKALRFSFQHLLNVTPETGEQLFGAFEAIFLLLLAHMPMITLTRLVVVSQDTFSVDD
jgi:hypothetical protein